MRGYTDRAGCVRSVTVALDGGVRVESDMMTRQGRKQWKKHVAEIRQRWAAREAELMLQFGSHSSDLEADELASLHE